jgi:hypothetical protein
MKDQYVGDIGDFGKAFLLKHLAKYRTDLVFCDPDNGIHQQEDGNSEQHVYLRDLRRYWLHEQSLLIYHHLNRTANHEARIQEMKVRLQREFNKSGVSHDRLPRGTARAYFLCVQETHYSRFSEEDKNLTEAIRPLLFTKTQWARLAKPCERHP